MEAMDGTAPIGMSLMSNASYYLSTHQYCYTMSDLRCNSKLSLFSNTLVSGKFLSPWSLVISFTIQSISLYLILSHKFSQSLFSVNFISLQSKHGSFIRFSVSFCTWFFQCLSHFSVLCLYMILSVSHFSVPPVRRFSQSYFFSLTHIFSLICHVSLLSVSFVSIS
jgi:hypothetical protein